MRRTPKMIFVFSFLMAFSLETEAAVTIDSVTSETGAAAAAVTFSHTVASDADYLVVCGGQPFGTFFSLVSATFNGDALVLLSSAATSGSDSAFMWGLANPDTGTHDVVLTWDGTFAASYGYSASFKGVDSVAGTVSATGTGSSLSQSVSSAADGMVMDCGWATFSGTRGVEGAGQTEITNDGTLPSVGSYKSSSGASTSMTWTLDGSVNWGHLLVGLAPESSGGQIDYQDDGILSEGILGRGMMQ